MAVDTLADGFLMRLHTIYITKACNMNCAYCYERSKKNENLDIISVNRILRHIYNTSSRKVFIEVIGGEPLLNWLIFLEICKYNADRDRMITTTTNGSLLTKDKISQLRKYNVLVGISYDGKSSHDIYRKDIYGRDTEQLIRENILVALTMGLNIVVNVTFHKANVSYIYNDIVDLVNCGVKRFKIHTVNNNMFKVDRKSRYSAYNNLLKLAAERNIVIDLSLDMQGSSYDHFYYYGSTIKRVKKGELGKWESVGWSERD